MTDTDAPGPAGWLPLKDAAAAYGISLRTMQRRVAAGEVECMRVKTLRGREWRIRPPGPGDVPDVPPGAPQAPTPEATGGPLVPLDRVEALLAPIVDERDRLRSEVTALQEARVTQAETIGRLQGKLEATEAELARLRATAAPTAPPARRRWPWQR